jgi:small conductance mechanosensitive channel
MDWLSRVDWDPVIDWLVSHGVRILVILILAWIINRVLKRLLPTAVRNAVARGMAGQPEGEIQKRAETLSRVFVATGMVLIATGAIFTILPELGVNIAPALAGFGIVGIAVGLGAQSLVRDLIGGFIILMENQYRVGDVVRVADVAGLVEDINLRRTVLRDLDGIVHMIPNGEIRVASNFTKLYSRVHLNVGVGYGEDLDHVIRVIDRVGQEIAQDPRWRDDIIEAPHFLRVDAFEDSGIAMKILGDTKPLRQWDVTGELRRRLKKAFDEEGIEIPWPHTKLYFGNAPPGVVWGETGAREPKEAEESDG